MSEEKKKQYIVVEPIRHQKKRQEPGAPVELDPGIGDPLVAQGGLKEAEPVPAGKQKKESDKA